MVPAHDSIRPSKRLGQHFLGSRSILRTIISAADLSPKGTVLEIGPGRGILTEELARHAMGVVAVEKDRALASALRTHLKEKGTMNVTIIPGDILKIPFSSLHLPNSYSVVANIPYYLTSRLIRLLLTAPHRPEMILLMVQREVAQRIVARPPRMNLLALSVQTYGTPKIIATVPASAFRPQPKVSSAIIKILNISEDFFRAHRIAADKFFAVARAGFSQKRKLLSNSLAALAGNKAKAEAVIATSGLAKTARPEELTPEEWMRLAKAIDP